jgi:hypothetical protein
VVVYTSTLTAALLRAKYNSSFCDFLFYMESTSRVYFHATDHTGSHRSMGILSCLFLMVLSAPDCSSRLTISTWPRIAAQCSAAS